MTVDLGSSPGVRGAPFTETFMIEMAETLSAWGPRHRIHTLPILAARLRRDPCGGYEPNGIDPLDEFPALPPPEADHV